MLDALYDYDREPTRVKEEDSTYYFPDGTSINWFSPRECKFDRQQVKWILTHLDLLLANYWPHSSEDGQGMIKVNNKKSKGPSLAPLDIAIEVEARLDRTGRDGDICRTFYLKGISYDELARLLAMPVEEVEKRVNRVIAYISGWWRKERSYKEYCQHKRHKEVKDV